MYKKSDNELAFLSEITKTEKQPSIVEKRQAFLMIMAVYTNILSKAENITFGTNDWEVAHNTHELPTLKKRTLRTLPVGSVYAQNLIEDIDIINEYITFSYVDPITQRHIDFTPKDIGTQTQKEIANTLYYLNSLNRFYTRYKQELTQKMKSKDSFYHLPTLSKDLIETGPYSYQPDLIYFIYTYIRKRDNSIYKS